MSDIYSNLTVALKTGKKRQHYYIYTYIKYLLRETWLFDGAGLNISQIRYQKCVQHSVLNLRQHMAAVV